MDPEGFFPYGVGGGPMWLGDVEPSGHACEVVYDSGVVTPQND